MTKTKIYQALFLAYLSLQVLILKSQDHPLSFNAGYGMGIEAFESVETLPRHFYEGPFGDYATSDISSMERFAMNAIYFQIGLKYRL